MCQGTSSLYSFGKSALGNDGSQQLPPQGDDRENEVGGLLAAASDFARSVLESIQALAGTTSCKGIQIARLKDWAIQQSCWIDKDTLISISSTPSSSAQERVDRKPTKAFRRGQANKLLLI